MYRLWAHYKHDRSTILSIDEVKDCMWRVPHLSVYGSRIYIMICIILDLADELNVVEKAHWEAFKWIIEENI